MKCKACGYNNKEGAKFCTSCGAPLAGPEVLEQDSAVLLQLAEAYTGILSVAKQIVADNPQNIRSISEACVAWIAAKDTTLFKDEGTSQPGDPTLDSFTNTEAALKDLDYEERIVVLMHCIEKMTPGEIAQILQLSEDKVIYYLQSAYQKNNPQQAQIPASTPQEKKKAARRRRPVRSKKQKDKEHSKLINHISNHAKIWIVVIVAVIGGTFWGVKKYAHDEYVRGKVLYDTQNYEEAEEPLLNAKRYGGSEDAGLKLGDVYYAEGNYEKALKEYEACKQEQSGVREAKIRTYEQLANASIEKNNYGDAESYLQMQYDLDEDEHTFLRLQAVQNNGSYTDENGNVYNAWGDPTKLVANKNGSKIFQIDLEYNDDRTLKNMKEYITEYSSKVTYNQFDSSKDMEASWYMQTDRSIAYAVETTVTDEKGNPTLITVTTPSSVKKTSYTYTYEQDQIQKAVIRTPSESLTAVYHYQGSVLTDIQYSDDSAVTYSYDKDGRKIHETKTKGNGDIVLDIAYEYDDQGRLIEKIVRDNTTDTALPEHTDQDRVYTYTSTGSASTMTIKGKSAEIAKGYYIENTGWIILYNN